MRDRFWAKVDQSAGPNGCWPWTAARTEKGYGRFFPKHGVGSRAHRMAYELTCGSVPPGRMVLHTCDNPPCCNPAHLYVGDALANTADMVAKCRHENGIQAGSRNPRAILTEPKVCEVWRRIRAGETNKSIAADFKVHHSTISAVRRKKTWDYLGAA
jgi:hypothetical protein